MIRQDFNRHQWVLEYPFLILSCSVTSNSMTFCDTVKLLTLPAWQLYIPIITCRHTISRNKSNVMCKCPRSQYDKQVSKRFVTAFSNVASLRGESLAMRFVDPPPHFFIIYKKGFIHQYISVYSSKDLVSPHFYSAWYITIQCNSTRTKQLAFSLQCMPHN